MAVLALSAAGAIAGSFIPGTFLGLTGAQIGWVVGGIVGSALFGPEGTKTYGPRLDDNTFDGDVEGTDIPILWGGDRMIGKPIWIKTPPFEVITKEETGGKGSSPTNTYYTYTYYQSMAFCFGEFISGSPRRVWLNGEIFYDVSGDNVAINKGLTFSWYPGDTDDIDSIIEQDVGIGNCPSYKGRSVMLIEGLNLTEKFGNRIPVVEAELQTTGIESDNITTFNMGEAIGAGTYNGVDTYVRHPTNNTIICNPLINNGFISSELFFVDLASQYIKRFWSGAVRSQIGYVLCSEIGSYDKNKITFLVLSEWSSVSVASLYKISYPEGKIIANIGFSGFFGGCELNNTESIFYLLGAQRNAGTTFAFIDKNTLQPDATYDINTLITPTDTGWYSSYFVKHATCIDWENSIWGTVAQRTGRKAAYYIINKNSILGPTVTWKSNIFDFITTDQTTNEKFYLATYDKGFYDEINNEVWYAWETSDTTLGYNLGLICLDATSGDQVYFVDFVQAGYTAASAYWGLASGSPVLGFDQTTRTLWWSLSGTGHKGSINIDSKKIKWYGATVGIGGSGGAWAIPYSNRNAIWSGTEIGDDFILGEINLGLVSQGTVAISTIVSDICERMDIAPSEYDVSTLTSKTIGSFIHATRHSARSDIELLLGIAIADGIETDYTLKFPLRGGSVIETLSSDDLAAQELTGQIEPVPPSIVTIPLDLEIPKVYEVIYRSIDNVYNKGIANSYLATGYNIDKQTSQLPVALYNQQAGDICQKYHQQLIDVKTYKFSLSIKYAYLNVSDIIEVPKNGKNYRVKLTRIDIGTNWILNCEGVSDFSEHYVANAIVPGVDDFIGTINIQTNPVMLILDGPLLRDIDSDHPGPYLTSFVYNNNYPLSSWFYSVDDSVFSPIVAQNIQTIVAQTLNTGNTLIWEEWSTVSLQIEILNDGSLSSSTKSAILADPTINAFAFGVEGRWEYINAATITLLSSTPTKKYELTDILRGRRGTNNNINNHQVGDYFVQLNSDTSILRQTLQNSQIGNTFYYKLPRSDQAVSDVDSKSIVNNGDQLKPYSPIQLVSVDNAGDVDSTWTRRTRKGGSLGGDNTLTDGVGGPLNEDIEQYEVEITNYVTGAILRTDTVTSPSHTYEAADQTSDGADVLAHFNINVYQMSSVVGRGFRAVYDYDKGWGQIAKYALDSNAKALFLLDDADTANAKEYVSNNMTAGTYTSASLSKAVSPDNVGALLGDSSGYMKAGRHLSDKITNKNKATIIIFGSGEPTGTESYINLTQGGSTVRFRLYCNSSTVYAYWAPKAGGTWAGTYFSNTTNTLKNKVWMIAATCNLEGTWAMKGYINGVDELTSTFGTGHSQYASVFQDQTRDANYNDTIAATIAASPTEIRSQGRLGGVMIFDSLWTEADCSAMYNYVIGQYSTLIDQKGSVNTHCTLSTATTSNTVIYARIGYNFNANNVFGNKQAITTGNAYGLEFYTNTRMYRNLPSEFMTSEFTVMMWVHPHTTALTTTNHMLSFEPSDWDGAVKKGFHVLAHSANGLMVKVGEGAGTFTEVHAGSANMSLNIDYCWAVSVHPTNGIKAYLNGVEVANNSAAAVSIDWTNGAGTLGPTTPTAYINTYNNGNNAAQASPNGTGLRCYANDFVYYTEELAAVDILELYNRGEGIIV